MRVTRSPSPRIRDEGSRVSLMQAVPPDRSHVEALV